MSENNSANNRERLVNPWPYVGLGILLGIAAFIGAVFLLGDLSGDESEQPIASPTEAVTALARVTETITVVRSTATPLATSESAPTPTEPLPTPTETPTIALPTVTPTSPPTPTATPFVLPTSTPLPDFPTNTPAAPGRPGAGSAWSAVFFGNSKLEGAPVAQRQDQAINFVWGAGVPDDNVAPDDFSARWTQEYRFPTGTYRFYARSNDGVRVYVNNVLIIDDWRTGRPRLRSIAIGLEAAVYSVRVEHFTAAGSAELQVWWQRADFDEWEGSYFDNPNLEGEPVLVRNDENINFDWGTFSPDEETLPADNFSVRWSRVLSFDPGYYTFNVTASDGVRLFVDGVLLIDAWTDGTKTGLSNGLWLHEGEHHILVEYYQRRERAEIQVSWTRGDLTINTWVAEFYDNIDLLGPPALVRGDGDVNFEWGDGVPAGGVPADNFSVRWTRTIDFEPGIYGFTARADDGVRVYAAGRLIIDQWQRQLATTYEGTRVLRNSQEIVVEYFDGVGEAEVSVSWERLGPPPD